MVLKRQLKQGDEGGSELPNKRSTHFASILLKGFNHGRTFQESASCLEPILRKMIRESVEQTIDRVMRLSYNQVEYHASRTLLLQFLCNLPETMFTGNRLLSKDRSPIKLVLCNSVSGQIVTSSHLSSLKVTIVVLEGDFVSDDREDWPAEEFDSKLVKTREGKRPLVAGETTVTLKDEVGYVGDLNFTDNSKWSRSGKFRLGAKAQPGSSDSIREAVSKAFRVKDHRGESYQKHYPPALDDEVWRLEKIAKDGTSHNKLNDSGIATVRDLLRLCTRNQSRLRDILDVSNRTWDTIIGHATKCDLGEEHFMYRSTQGILFFNSVHKVVGVNFDGINYHPANAINSFQMRLVEELKQQAYNNLAEWIPVSYPLIAGYHMLLGNTVPESFMNPNLGCLSINFQEQGQHGIEMNIPYHSELGQDSYHLGESSHCPPQASFIPTFRNSFVIGDPTTGFSIGAHHSWVPEGNYAGSHLSTDDPPIDDPFQVKSSAWHGNGLSIDCGNHGISMISSDSGLLVRTGSPKTKWCKVLAVVKWRILVRRNVAARKWERFYGYV